MFPISVDVTSERGSYTQEKVGGHTVIVLKKNCFSDKVVSTLSLLLESPE